MKRREFIRTCATGMLAGTASAAASDVFGAEQNSNRRIEPAQLAETAYRHFIPGKRTCCESILQAGCQALGIESPLVPDITLGLAGGVGLQGEVCGVLTSSAMVISLAVAQKEVEYPKTKMRTLQSAGQLFGAFKKQFGHTDCRSLCGLDLTTPEGRKKLEEGVKEYTCARFVKAAAELLAQELERIQA